MTTKYYYKGKLLRTSKSSKLSYNYAIYNAETGTAKSLSKDYEALAYQRKDQIEHFTAQIRFLKQTLETGYTSWGRPLAEEDRRDREYELESSIKWLKWWIDAEIVEVEKVVID